MCDRGWHERGDDLGGRWRCEGPQPRRGGKVGLNKKGANDVICSANETFLFAILGRGVTAIKPIGDVIGKEERVEGGVDELPTIVTLHGFDGDIVLGVDEHEKAL